MIEKVVFYHRAQDGGLSEITVNPADYELIMNYARDYDSLYRFLDRLGKWKKVEEVERDE